jgi:hypothetical protein
MDAGPPQARKEPKNVAFAEASISTAGKHAPQSKARDPNVLLKHVEYPALKPDVPKIGPSLALDVCLGIDSLRWHTRVLRWGTTFG